MKLERDQAGMPNIPSLQTQGFAGGSAVQNPPANARDTGLIPALRRSPGEGNGNPWEIPWTEEPGGLQSMGSQRVRHD